MQLRTEAPRHPLWGKETLLRDVAKYGAVLKVCRMYGGEKWSAYRNDVWVWRKLDPEFRHRLSALIKRRGDGRPRLDGGDKGWMDGFFEALERHNLDETKARLESGCPYSERQLREFRSRSASSYDKDFADRWDDARLRVVNAAKAEAVKLLAPVEIPEEYEERTVKLAETKAKIQQMRANTLTKILQSLDREEWGRELHMKGSVEHRHLLEARFRPKEEALLALTEERKNFERRQGEQFAALPSGDTVDAEPVEDAEVIEDAVEATGDE